MGHGYLLTGPRGVGKTTAARILAMALNCERKGSAEPAGRAVRRVPELPAASGTAPPTSTWWRSTPRATAASTTPATSASGRCMPPPARADHKVYIVDEAHMLTREAWNALLKILEEPPPGVVFVFATTEPQKIAQRRGSGALPAAAVRLPPHRSRSIRERLRAVLAAERIEAEDDALVLIARQADGGMRDALSVLDQCLSFGGGQGHRRAGTRGARARDGRGVRRAARAGGGSPPGGRVPSDRPAGGGRAGPGGVCGRRRPRCCARC